ncbi:glycerophosphodiester phosphodiesterase [Neobacillus sp. YIM B02564]|uniref:Glycerophosphodiester phosphodiesterase n=1 Tax=Neobacillus paridis TaxID=2803862 RepID=A0ABS1TWG8_9BACI|nr:glycerophosphodiester phosphodiesterase [Neobacillus paridis]
MRVLLLLWLVTFPVHTTAAGFGKERMTIIAHRGASGDAPEHTIAAYQLAVEQGADYIELDLHMTKDRQLIAIHDDTLDRTTNGSGKVHAFTLAEIKQLDAGSWFNHKYPGKAQPYYHGQTIPTLAEVINHYGKSINYYIEIKKPQQTPKMADELLRVLRQQQLIGKRTGPADRGKIIIESFHPDSLKYLRHKAPELLLIQLGEDAAEMKLAEIAQYADGVGPNFSTLNEEFVKLAHRHGLLVHCWTVNSETAMIKLNSWNVDGIFTNYVKIARKHVGKHGEE